MIIDNHYHIFNVFSNFGKLESSEINRGKNLVDFEMNSVCTGILLDFLTIHMVSEKKGYTFVQDVGFESYPKI